MKVMEALVALRPYLIFLSVFFIVGSILAVISGPVTIDANSSTLHWLYADLMKQVDLRNEVVAASWFEGVLFLIVAVSFALLGWGKSGTYAPGRWRVFFQAMALIFVFLALDETVSLHEQLGKQVEYTTGIASNTEIANKGYSWVLVYLPAALVVLVLLFCAFKPLLAACKNSHTVAVTQRYMIGGGLAILGVFALEGSEAALYCSERSAPMMQVFEEALELLVLWCFLQVTSRMAENYQV